MLLSKSNQTIEPNGKNIVSLKYGFTHWLKAILSIIAVSSYPILFLYFQNSDEASFADVIVPLIIFIGAGVMIFLISYIIIKCVSKAAIISSLFMLLLMNYSFLERGVRTIFPGLYYWHIFLICLFILGHIVWFIYKKVNKDIANLCILIINIVFCGLILLNGLIATPKIVNKISFEKQLKEQKVEEKILIKDDDMPNIYYLIFDEYSSIDFIKKYYNYDNSAFADNLEKIGFNVSYTSHNESTNTATITANLVNLDYIVKDKMPASEKDFYRKNNFLFNYLAKRNYEIVGVGDVKFYGLNNAVSTEKVSSKTIDGKTIADIIYERTFISPFYKNYSYTKGAQEILDALEYLKGVANYSKNTFVLSHIVCPHAPFYFKSNGVPYKNPMEIWKDNNYYLGQYIFITSQIVEIVDSIITNDPECVIIVQSDHSARADSYENLNKFELKDKKSIFNAVYFKGEKIDIEGLSGVNTLRCLLNELFNDDFEMLEVPIDNSKLGKE